MGCPKVHRWHPCLFSLLLLIWFTKGIQAQDGQGPERRYACWGSFGPPVVSAQCPRDTVLHVLRAGLKVQSRGGGAECTYSDGDCGCVQGELGCNMPNVRALCMGRPACRLDVTQQYINTDSCRGFSDYMYIEYNCVPETKTDIVDICANSHDSARSGFIRSPNYPSASTYKQKCQCSLKSAGSFAIRVLDFHNGEGDCDIARLQVSMDGQQQDLCENGQMIGQDLTSGGSVMLTFDTNGQGTSNGFWLQYQSEDNAIDVRCRLKARVQTGSSPAKPVGSPVAAEDARQAPSSSNTDQKEAEGADSDRNNLAKPASRYRPIPRTDATRRRAPPSQRRRPSPSGRSSPNPAGPGNSANRARSDPLLPDSAAADASSPWWWRYTADGEALTTVFPPWTGSKTKEANNQVDKDAADADAPVDLPGNAVVDGSSSSLPLHGRPDSPSSPHSGRPGSAAGNPAVHDPPQQPVFSHSRNDPAHNQYSSNGLYPEMKKPKSNTPQGESITVTIIAACVIGSILLIVIIGIVVRFVINRADPNYTMRQNHKKECAIRRNAQMQRHGF